MKGDPEYAVRTRARGKFADEDWPEAKQQQLRDLWADRVATYKIGIALGCTDTTVRKWAEKLGLPLRSKNQHLARPAGRAMSNEPVRAGCQWIEGDPKTDTMCGQKREPGKPYCDDHCRRAFVALKPRTGFTLGPNYGVR